MSKMAVTIWHFIHHILSPYLTGKIGIISENRFKLANRYSMHICESPHGLRFVELKLSQCPSIHANYIITHCTTL